MALTIALAGNPNSGKTTLFNNLTGGNQYVGNWPGVTVEKKDGVLKGRKDVIIQDLPGIYSLSPYTMEEVVTRNYLLNQKPDAIINIIDASHIERNLFLTTQLLEIGVPVVLALNMIDTVQKKGDQINVEKLAKVFGCPVVEMSALKNIGMKEAVERALEAAKNHAKALPLPLFSERVEQALADIEKNCVGLLPFANIRWVAIKLFERDTRVLEKLDIETPVMEKIEAIITSCEKELDDDSESIITNERYHFIAGIVSECVTYKNKAALSTSDKIDGILTNRVLALPIFAAIIYLVYYLSISSVGTLMTDWVNDALFGELIPNAVGGFLESVGTSPWLYGLVMNGIVAGVGAVLGFLPQMCVLFLCLAFLEDCGYMARIAFILDRIFRRFGLSGKSFIPMLISTGCGVPGVMASRTIESENDRRMTVMTATFMPCGAKLPIIALIAGALFPGVTWVGPSVYFMGIAAIILTGIMLKKTRLFSGEPSPFVLELPSYHMPTPRGLLHTTLERAWAFIKRAGTIVMLATTAIWFLQSFNASLDMVDPNDSLLALLGQVFAPVFAPLGFGNWRAAVATVTGLIAKENVVATFGVLYGFAEVAEDGAEIWPQLVAAYTPLAAYSFLAFNMLCAPCFAAIGAIHREMMSPKWTMFAVGYQCAFAYAVSLIIYQIGMLAAGSFGPGTVAAFALIALIIYMLVKKPYSVKPAYMVNKAQKVGM